MLVMRITKNLQLEYKRMSQYIDGNKLYGNVRKYDFENNSTLSLCSGFECT